jgi:uncharacterized membrane protein YgcG
MSRKAAVVLIVLGGLATLGGAGLWTLQLIEAEHSWEDIGYGPGLWIAGAGVLVALAGVVLYGRKLSNQHSAPGTFLTPAEEGEVMKAIEDFEKRTSGELRVHLEAHVDGDLMEVAKKTFAELGLTATRDRNGVLFFVAVKDHQFAVLGDQGIDQKVPPGFWDQTVAAVKGRFKEHKFGEGLVEGIKLAGEQLVAHFPPRPDDVNELPNQISRST